MSWVPCLRYLHRLQCPVVSVFASTYSTRPSPARFSFKTRWLPALACSYNHLPDPSCPYHHSWSLKRQTSPVSHRLSLPILDPRSSQPPPDPGLCCPENNRCVISSPLCSGCPRSSSSPPTHFILSQPTSFPTLQRRTAAHRSKLRILRLCAWNAEENMKFGDQLEYESVPEWSLRA